jgi:hypothetical protein
MRGSAAAAWRGVLVLVPKPIRSRRRHGTVTLLPLTCGPRYQKSHLSVGCGVDLDRNVLFWAVDLCAAVVLARAGGHVPCRPVFGWTVAAKVHVCHTAHHLPARRSTDNGVASRVTSVWVEVMSLLSQSTLKRGENVSIDTTSK